MPSPITPTNTFFFVCDIQTKFSTAISGWDHVVYTAKKMLDFARILNVPVLATEQNPKALGGTDPVVGYEGLPNALKLGVFPKTKFSMLLPETTALMEKLATEHVVIFGIESHICVLQTVLAILAQEPRVAVHVIADGVSSCNREEVAIALARMAAAGASVTTSESVLFQLMSDAGEPTFKTFSKEVKAHKERTSASMNALLGDGAARNAKL